MVAVISDFECTSCRRKHAVCLPTEDMFAAGHYEYDCPVTGRAVVFAAGKEDWDIIDVTCPPKHVVAVRLPV
jgi:hypothetical protein